MRWGSRDVDCCRSGNAERLDSAPCVLPKPRSGTESQVGKFRIERPSDRMRNTGKEFPADRADKRGDLLDNK